MKFDPEKSLFELPTVKTIAIVTGASTSIVIVVIYVTSNLSFQSGYSGINNLIEIFKIPLGILAIGLSLIGLCGANHRSEQTRKQIERTAKQIDLSTLQIEATRSQNNFSNYYKHAEEFSKLCSRIKGIRSVNSPQKLHTKIFPQAQVGIFTIDRGIVQEFENYGSDLRHVLLEMANDNTFNGLWSLHKVNHFYTKRYWLSPVVVESGGRVMEVQKNSLRVPMNGPRGYIELHMSFVRAMDEIFSFDTTYHSPKIISVLSDMGLGYVPEKTDSHISINFPDLVDSRFELTSSVAKTV